MLKHILRIPGKKKSKETLIDDHDRRQAETKRQESFSLLRIAGEKAKIGGWIVNRAENRSYWSDEVSAIFEKPPGYTPRIGEGTNFYAPEWREQFIEIFNACERDGTPFDREMEIITAGGKRLWVRTIGEAVRDENGKIYKIQGAFQDINDRKLGEIELERTRALLEQTSRIARVGGWETNLLTQEVIWSDVKKEIYEVPENYVPDIQATLDFFMEGENRDTITRLVKKAVETGEEYDVELKILTAKGNERWVRTKGSPVFYEGNCVRLFGTTQDITRHRLAEEEHEKLQAQLNQAQKMESVGRLAGGVAHDFNNMLGVIIGHTEIALERTEPSGVIFENLKEILNAASRSADLTKQLLAFARKQTMAPRVLNLNEKMEGMLKMIGRLIGENIKLVWRPADTVCPVKMDSSQIDQIITNLCINAADAIDGVGQLSIATGNCTLDEVACKNKPDSKPGNYVLLSVVDNGCGMDKYTIDNIFEPFFTTKEVGRGTGLGLSTVYGIVTQNKGFVEVESTIGKGSAFKIYLPCHTGIMENSGEMKADASLTGTETILLVEDEAVMLHMIKIVLENLGYTVITASTPGDAFTKAKIHGNKIRLVLTDIVMPEMNGRDMALSLLEKYPEYKVLFMSGYTADVVLEKGALEKGVHFIQKPFRIKDLALKIRNLLDRDPKKV